MSAVRAKFRCNMAREVYGSVEVNLSAVTGDGGEENKAFWDATPNGSLTMYVTNKDASDYFEPGREFYLTFEAA